jgi:hypothetical protein
VNHVEGLSPSLHPSVNISDGGNDTRGYAKLDDSLSIRPLPVPLWIMESINLSGPACLSICLPICLCLCFCLCLCLCLCLLKLAGRLHWVGRDIKIKIAMSRQTSMVLNPLVPLFLIAGGSCCLWQQAPKLNLQVFILCTAYLAYLLSSCDCVL